MAEINKAIQGEDIQGKGFASACLLMLEEKEKVQKER